MISNLTARQDNICQARDSRRMSRIMNPDLVNLMQVPLNMCRLESFAAVCAHFFNWFLLPCCVPLFFFIFFLFLFLFFIFSSFIFYLLSFIFYYSSEPPFFCRHFCRTYLSPFLPPFLMPSQVPIERRGGGQLVEVQPWVHLWVGHFSWQQRKAANPFSLGGRGRTPLGWSPLVRTEKSR